MRGHLVRLRVAAACSLCAVALNVSCAASPTRHDELVAKLGELARKHQRDSVFLVRHNPTRCDVPPNEVLLGDRWVRVKLLPDRPVGLVAAINSRLAKKFKEGQVGAVARVKGVLSRDVQEAENMSLFLELEVEADCSAADCNGAASRSEE